MSVKSDWFEFIAENAAFFSSNYIINKYYPDKMINGNSINSLMVAPIYYAGVDLFYPEMIRKLVLFLSDSTLGRYILRRLMKIESNKAINILISVGFILAIKSTLGLKPDLLQIAQILSFQFATDEASELIY